LTISSDEEEEDRIKKTGNTNSNAIISNLNNAFNDDMDTILDKEPIITNTSVPSLYDDIMDEEDSIGDVLYDTWVMRALQLTY